MSKKVIIDTDPGVDDAMAILLALKSPEIELVGLTTIYGNVYTDLATQNALRLVELTGRPDIPVAHGAESPLLAPLGPAADFVHGWDGLGNINLPPPQGRAVDRPAAQFIVETVMAYPGEITLVPIGPLTNLALALALEPRIADHVAEVVVMGGAATVNGNVTPAAEANIINDPHAADMVFTAAWPVTMVGLDVTMQIIMTDDYMLALKTSGSPMAEFIYTISRFYRDFHYDTHGLAGMHTHDPSAIAYVLDPTLFTTVRGPLRVVTEGIAAGQTLLDRRQNWRQPNAWTGQPMVNVCLGADAERLLALYRERITA
ncbi:MAG: nucleoside hydrolase [Anaerolineales bacterium]|nr:nucleoside hydrolase [Anaerolineales bacterium]